MKESECTKRGDMKKKEKARLVKRAIKLTWSSLRSHLPYTRHPYKKGEPVKHHKQCVREYAEVLHTLCRLL